MVVDCSGQVRAGSLLTEPAPTYTVGKALREFTGIYQPSEHISGTYALLIIAYIHHGRYTASRTLLHSGAAYRNYNPYINL